MTGSWTLHQPSLTLVANASTRGGGVHLASRLNRANQVYPFSNRRLGFELMEGISDEAAETVATYLNEHTIGLGFTRRLE